MCDAVYNTKVHRAKLSGENLWLQKSGKHNPLASFRLWLELLHMHGKRVFYSSNALANEVSHGIINQTFASQIALCFGYKSSFFLHPCFVSSAVIIPSGLGNIPLHRENYKISFNFPSASLFLFSRVHNKTGQQHDIIKIIKTFLRKFSSLCFFCNWNVLFVEAFFGFMKKY